MWTVFTDKIILRFQSILISGFVFMLTTGDAVAQDMVLNKYGLWVLHSYTELKQTTRNAPGKAMVDLRRNIPGILLDLRYAGVNNFMHQQLYPVIKTTYLRKTAVDSLKVIQEELHKYGLGLKLFDAYRPYSVTERMWEPVKDDRYAADPKKGSGHNRGIAVDLTLVNLLTKEELDMGTGFDNFSDTAHHAFTGLPSTVLQNRAMLKKIMEAHGFKALDTEWWHYYLPDTKNYELMDIPFNQLKKFKNQTHAERNTGTTF